MTKPMAPSRPLRPPMASPPTAAQANNEPISLRRGVQSTAHKIVIYGPGGVGKSELASLINPVFVDIEEGSHFLDVLRVAPTPSTLEDILTSVRQLIDEPECTAIVIDSLTKAEELAVDYVIRTIPHEKKDVRITSVESYGFGKGYTHVYEAFLLLLQSLDAAARAGKHVIGICHDCTANVPNPAGEDWIRYEPRLQSPASGKGSIRHRVKEWCDHLLYVGFDTFVSDDGKASGSGTRTIYPVELPTHWAKSRSLSEPIAYRRRDETLWKTLGVMK